MKTRNFNRTTWTQSLEESLVARGVFKPKMIELIKGEAQDEDGKVRQLYLDVQKRGPKAFKNLTAALVDSGNVVAANLLDSTIVIDNLPSPMPQDENK